ncbi:MAG: glycerol-3-phosphate acyltransferase [Elainellaceae cyanobacterium]
MGLLTPLFLFITCFILGALPLTGLIVRGVTSQSLKDVGTGNVGVSAAFYHGGQGVGILCVLAEAFKGIAAVLLFRWLMPGVPALEVVGLIALVAGRFMVARGAGTTNVVWGFLVHDWKIACIVAVIGGTGFTLLREKRIGRLSILLLLPLVTALLYPQSGGRLVAVMVLSVAIGWIYQVMPDDLNLAAEGVHSESRKTFRFFRGDRAIRSLNDRLDARTSGGKAARLAELKYFGYPVPMGWVLPPGDDPQPLLDTLTPLPDKPLVVRSSAIGEDGETASAAGQYDSILNVTSREELERAIAHCQRSYGASGAVRYRSDRQVAEGGMAVLIQRQVRGVFSGVAFSRDPVSRQGEAVIVEALPGEATQVVSGQTTPDAYQVWFHGEAQKGLESSLENSLPESAASEAQPDWALPSTLQVEVEGEGNVPLAVVKQVAYLARHLERQYQDVPQDLEWTYDGQRLWVLQVRPITTLIPVWTRKIAAEVIPGFIRPLTWSINQPLTCGVWGDIFTLVLGDRSQNLDFSETATLHHSSAYFNASLLGTIFRRMGLPPESLEFLTRGAKFSRPPVASTVRNVPGLVRLLQREWKLEQSFQQDKADRFDPMLEQLQQQPPDQLSPEELVARIQIILNGLKPVTYYNILGPLSAALRQAMLKVDDADLDTSALPEVAAMRSLQTLARNSRPLVPHSSNIGQRSTLMTALAECPEGSEVMKQLDQFINTYGYLSEVATDIAVPTWKDDPRPIYDLFAQAVQNPTHMATPPVDREQQGWQAQLVQSRIDLKGSVAELYNRLLAHLRWSILALEKQWIEAGHLVKSGDIFFLTLNEIEQQVQPHAADQWPSLRQWIDARRDRWKQDSQVPQVPYLVYGEEPPRMLRSRPKATAGMSLQGIGASPGQVEGTVKIVRSLQDLTTLDKTMILVVPYADSGWAPLLAQAGGLVADVGGRLSHGAIIAREYGIPAVMNVQDGISRLHEGQRVYLDGELGTVEIL